MVRALEPAFRDEVDLVVHSGDVFDRSRPPAVDVARAFAVFAEVARRVPLVVIAGNHDRRGLARHAPEPPPGLTMVDAPWCTSVGGARFGFVPYCRTADAFAHAAQGLGPVDLLVCHQAFDGVAIPHAGRSPFVFRVGHQADTVDARHVPAVGAVACGHIHPRQVVRVGEIEVVHPGSTERTAFSERAQTKGYAVWTLGRRATWRFVDLPSRPMRVVASAADIDEVGAGDLVRVEARSLIGEALRRGAHVVPPRTRSRSLQLRLFR